MILYGGYFFFFGMITPGSEWIQNKLSVLAFYVWCEARQLAKLVEIMRVIGGDTDILSFACMPLPPNMYSKTKIKRLDLIV